MGVPGLWQLVEPAGEPVSLESLAGQRLAIDVSLWLHQAAKARQHDGDVSHRAPHLSLLFHRVLKLLYYDVRPVFVFDGPNVPAAKRRVLNERRVRRELADVSAAEAHAAAIRRYIRQQAAAGTDGSDQTMHVPRQVAKRSAPAGSRGANDPHLFVLPEGGVNLADDDVGDDYSSGSDEEVANPAAEQLMGRIMSAEFDALPVEDKRDMLVAQLDTFRSRRVCGGQLPTDLRSLSQFQLCRMLQRSEVSGRLAAVGKQIRAVKAAAALAHCGLPASGLEHAVDTGGCAGLLVKHSADGERPESSTASKQNDDAEETSVVTAPVPHGLQQFSANWIIPAVRTSPKKRQKLNCQPAASVEHFDRNDVDKSHCGNGRVLDQDDSDSDFEDVPDIDLATLLAQHLQKSGPEDAVVDLLCEEPVGDSESETGEVCAGGECESAATVAADPGASTSSALPPAAVDDSGSYAECEQLLRLFGVPFVRAPAEAEAQCAVLDRLGLVAACVTDDSDAMLFGANTIYRWLFNKQRHVQRYRSDRIHANLGISRRQLIQLAVLSGCDYTAGVRGVGCVSGLEILAEFGGSQDGEATGLIDDSTVPSVQQRTAEAHSAVKPLLEFKRWWMRMQEDDTAHASLSKERCRLAKLRATFPPSWPDAQVYAAFRWPTVDGSTERFTFGRPDVHGLVEFGHRAMGWPEQRVTHALAPVLAQLEKRSQAGGSGMRQTRLDQFSVRIDRTAANMRCAHGKRTADALSALHSKAQDGNAAHAATAASTSATSGQSRKSAARQTKSRRGTAAQRRARETIDDQKSKELDKSLDLSEEDSS